MEVYLGNRWFPCSLVKENDHTVLVRLGNGKTIKRHKEKHSIYGLEEERERLNNHLSGLREGELPESVEAGPQSPA